VSFVRLDVGAGLRSPAAKGHDCTVRALMTATILPYQTAWCILYEHQGHRQSNCFDLCALIELRTGCRTGRHHVR
jgi:hypothetical protein